jgi:hypothetical protein
VEGFIERGAGIVSDKMSLVLRVHPLSTYYYTFVVKRKLAFLFMYTKQKEERIRERSKVSELKYTLSTRSGQYIYRSYCVAR